MNAKGFLFLGRGVNFPIALEANGSAFIRFFNLLNDIHKEHPDGDEYGLILTGGLEIDW